MEEIVLYPNYINIIKPKYVTVLWGRSKITITIAPFPIFMDRFMKYIIKDVKIKLLNKTQKVFIYPHILS